MVGKVAIDIDKQNDQLFLIIPKLLCVMFSKRFLSGCFKLERTKSANCEREKKMPESQRGARLAHSFGSHSNDDDLSFPC